MNLAIAHYHLNRGGVTRAIENHLRALDAALDVEEPWRVAVIYGGRRQGWNESLADELRHLRLTLHEAPLLEYDSDRADGRAQPDALADEVETVLGGAGFAAEGTVLHVHNPALGKNVSLPGAVRLLAQRGYRMLLQPHDFAEDFRPDNFQALAAAGAACGAADDWHAWLYPQAPHIYYAVLTGRDFDVLRTAGVEPGRLHLLPNPVSGMEKLPPRDRARAKLADRFGVGPGERLVLYPVRCIRRKNVGEALLYSVLAPPGTVVGMTLPPLNPAERTIYDAWVKLAAELELPCRFGLGAEGGLSFGESLAAADLILTTSLAEGFGMVFLESWLAGRVLVGRDLPEITADFTQNGVRLEHLRPQLRVPLAWVGGNSLRRSVLETYHRTLAAYGRAEPDDEIDALEAKLEDGLVDFADLDEPRQSQVLRIVADSEAGRRRVLEINPWLAGLFDVPAEAAEELTRHNAAAIESRFSLVPSGERLLAMYRRTAAESSTQPPAPLDGAAEILNRFLALGRFRLLRS